jgi:hypothetical protein
VLHILVLLLCRRFTAIFLKIYKIEALGWLSKAQLVLHIPFRWLTLANSIFWATVLLICCYLRNGHVLILAPLLCTHTNGTFYSMKHKRAVSRSLNVGHCVCPTALVIRSFVVWPDKTEVRDTPTYASSVFQISFHSYFYESTQLHLCVFLKTPAILLLQRSPQVTCLVPVNV